MLPSVRRLDESSLPLRLSPLTLLVVTEGHFVLRDDSGVHGLACGDLLAVRASAPAELGAARGSGEALLFHAPADWVERVLALCRTEGMTPPAEPLAREAAGSESARRAGRVLLAAHREGVGAPSASPQSGVVGIEHAGRLVELVGIAYGMRGSLVAPRPLSARARSRRARLVRALEALEGAPLENLSLGVLARMVGVSERHASRLLREELGRALPDYLSALRIERAKKLLVTTKRPVTEIALETGWHSLSHFNTIFRRRVGTTPSVYRALACGDDVPA